MILCGAISYHLYNLKNHKNTHGSVLLLVRSRRFWEKGPQTLIDMRVLGTLTKQSLNATYRITEKRNDITTKGF